MAESLHHLDFLIQLQAKSFQETLEKHVNIDLFLNLFWSQPQVFLFYGSCSFPIIPH